MSTSACGIDEKMVVVVVVEGRTEGVCFMLFHHVCHHACSILQIDLVESGPIFGSHIGTYPRRYLQVRQNRVIDDGCRHPEILLK